MMTLLLIVAGLLAAGGMFIAGLLAGSVHWRRVARRNAALASKFQGVAGEYRKLLYGAVDRYPPEHPDHVHGRPSAGNGG